MSRFVPSALLLLPLAACGSGLTGDPTAGEAIYADNCASCHGVDASGGSGPNLLGEVEEGEATDIILNGEGDMPAFADSLSDQDIADVIAYLQDLGGSGGED